MHGPKTPLGSFLIEPEGMCFKARRTSHLLSSPEIQSQQAKSHSVSSLPVKSVSFDTFDSILHNFTLCGGLFLINCLFQSVIVGVFVYSYYSGSLV